MDEYKMEFRELNKKLNRIEEDIRIIDNKLSSLRQEFTVFTNNFNKNKKPVTQNSITNKLANTKQNPPILFSYDGMRIIVLLMLIGMISAVIYLSIQ